MLERKVDEHYLLTEFLYFEWISMGSLALGIIKFSCISLAHITTVFGQSIPTISHS